MSENRPHSILPSKGNFFSDLLLRLKLIFRLMGDNRVNALYKLIPLGTFVYLLFPDIAPGPIDDAAIIWLGMYLFVELCPPDVVEEHMRALGRTIPARWEEPKAGEGEIVDADYKED